MKRSFILKLWPPFVVALHSPFLTPVTPQSCQNRALACFCSKCGILGFLNGQIKSMCGGVAFGDCDFFLGNVQHSAQPYHLPFKYYSTCPKSGLLTITVKCLIVNHQLSRKKRLDFQTASLMNLTGCDSLNLDPNFIYESIPSG